MNNEIIAIRDNQYLIKTKPNFGRILDINSQQLFQEQHIQSILKFGYWEEYKGEETFDSLMKNNNITVVE